MRVPSSLREALPRGAALALRGLTLLLAALVLLPIAYLLLRAAETWEPHGAVLGASSTLRALRSSLLLAGGVAAAGVALALPLGWLTHATDLPLRRLFRVVLNLPLAVPSYVSGFVVLVALGPAGWARDVLAAFGLSWDVDIYGGFGAALALMPTYPLALLVVQAALRRVDPAQWEAARSLGRSPISAFASVVLPQIRGALLVGAVLIALYVLGDFGAVSLLRYDALSYVIYVRYKSLIGREEAVFLSLLLVALALLLVAALRRLDRSARPASGEAGERPWPVVPLGRWRWPAFAFCALVAAAGVFVPVGMLLAWLVRGLRLGHTIALPLEETVNAMALGATAAAIVVSAALLPSLVRALRGRPRGGGLGWVSYAGYVLPGIVVALALVSLSIRHARPLYQTLVLLLVAYVIRFLPLAVGGVEAAFTRQSPRLVEAARSLGCSPFAAWRRVSLPNVRGALVAGFIAAFIAVVKELPATLVLSPIGFRTLATTIWSLTEEAYYSQAAPASLLMIALATAALWIGLGDGRLGRGGRR